MKVMSMAMAMTMLVAMEKQKLKPEPSRLSFKVLPPWGILIRTRVSVPGQASTPVLVPPPPQPPPPIPAVSVPPHLSPHREIVKTASHRKKNKHKPGKATAVVAGARASPAVGPLDGRRASIFK